MRENLFAMGMLLALVSCQPSGVPSEEVQAIRTARLEHNDAIARHDTVALGQYWTEDFHIISSRNAERSGRADNVTRFAAEFKAKPDIVYIRHTDKVDVFAEWKMASEQGHWEGRWTENGQPVEIHGTYFAKWHKVDGRWLIRGEIFVPLGCGGPGCVSLI